MNKLRENLIIDLVNKESFVTAADMCRHFDVSPATIRRDLAALEKEGKIHRTHGGAKSVLGTSLTGNTKERNARNRREKEAIAAYCASILKENDVIFLDAATTVVEIAKKLVKSEIHITVVTNDIEIAYLLRENGKLDIYIVGGLIKKFSSGSDGLFVEKELGQFYFTKCFIGFDTCDANNGISVRSADGSNYVSVKRFALSRSAVRYAVGASEKFGKTSFVRVANIDELDYIVTDDGLSEDIKNEFNREREMIITVDCS